MWNTVIGVPLKTEKREGKKTSESLIAWLLVVYWLTEHLNSKKRFSSKSENGFMKFMYMQEMLRLQNTQKHKVLKGNGETS